MIVRWIKWAIRLIVTLSIWENIGPLLAIIYFIICIPLDFFALMLCDKMAIKGFQRAGAEDRSKAVGYLASYQRNPYPAPPVRFSQLILGPLLSISIPIILGGLFLWQVF